MTRKIITPKGSIIKIFIHRRVLFEKVQNNGDSSITGRFAHLQTSRRKVIDVNNFQEDKK